MAARKPKASGLKEKDAGAPKTPSQSGSGSNWLLSIAICLAIFTGISTVVFFAIVLAYIRDLSASRRDYSALQELTEVHTEPYIGAFDAGMRDINSDSICWIKIKDTNVDYPVVRGNDNETYLNTSFFGEDNVFGTLFMDYRCEGEYVPHIIIYGHNSRHGDMFGGLDKFLDEDYRAEHPVITLNVNDRTVEYEIFSARKTNIDDPAYFLDFSAPGSFQAFSEKIGAPTDAVQIVTLSTCVSGDDDDERIIVQGVLQ